MPGSIRLVDDDESLLRLLTIRLRAVGYEAVALADPHQALATVATRDFDVVVTDLRMPGIDGMALLASVHERRPTVPVIMLTAHGTIPDAVAATRAGVFAFLTKPFDSAELLDAIARALAVTGHTEPSNADVPRSAAAPSSVDDDDMLAVRTGITTRSPAMREVLRQASLAAASDVPVMILGESGTGKELLARAIHRLSPRAARPFSALNCAALPETLFESELFGHEKGAFTGAQHAHPGVFRGSDRGTVFLDEIGDMPAALQAKFLRVLQDKEVRPVGSLKAQPVDVRIVSATHRDLDEGIAAGRFREDLYYRLKGVVLKLPALAERREDIALLAQQFVAEIAGDSKGAPTKTLVPEAVEMLMAAPWPGNVRQLRNVVQQAAVLSAGEIVPASAVATALEGRRETLPSFDAARRDFERDYLIRVLKLTGGSVARAAQIAQRNRQDFYKLLKRHSLESAMFKAPAATPAVREIES